MSDDHGQRPESLLPYKAWEEEAIREALRQVMLQALEYVAAKGLPGEHHLYIEFRTDHPGVVVPDRLRAQYPREMTIVLQHQFWDLEVDRAARVISVGLSFGGVATTLRIPFDSVTQFFDRYVEYGHRFEPVMPEPKPVPGPLAVVASQPSVPAKAADEEAQVVSLDAFRRRPPVRDS